MGLTAVVPRCDTPPLTTERTPRPPVGVSPSDLWLYTSFMGRLPTRPLGNSGIEVSLLALGSWRTYERISREQGLAVMLAAKECGVTFLDDARYNDETRAGADGDGLLRGGLRRALSRGRLETRPDCRCEQALVGVLA